MTPNPDPRTLADDAVRRLLLTQWGDSRPRVVLVNSPPGAGKTWAVERLAAQALHMRERCMVATQTNEQAFDLVRRLAEDFPSQTVWLFAKAKLQLPPALQLLEGHNLRVARRGADIPRGPAIVVSNGAKWSWLQDAIELFDLLIVDEGYQLHDYRFMQVTGLAHRCVVVGDPGQIDPVVRAEVERWRSEPAGPHVPCPAALLARFGGAVVQIDFPVSRRLPASTVDVVQPSFYPQLPFQSLATPDERRLTFGMPGATAIDDVLNASASGRSLVVAELPPRVTGEHDEEAAASIVAVVERMVRERDAKVVMGGTEQQVEPAMIGIACAHVSQVNAVRERLPADFVDVLVETANRFQGLERHLMVVQHPLSGRTDASEFHLDSGRLCVMLSRHSVVCFVFARAGLLDLLYRHTPSGNRAIGVEEDDEYLGWRAHVEVLERLRRADAVRPIVSRHLERA